MPVDKNIKCEAHELERFDNLMKNEKQLPNSRHEFLTRLMNVYESGCNTEPTIKEVEVIKEVPVEKIVYVDKPKTASTIDKNIKLKINSILTWLDKNTQYFPTNHNLEVRDKRNEIRELVWSL